MPDYAEDMNVLQTLRPGEQCTVNWFEEGGGVVYMLPNYTYILFSVPQYGGYEAFEGCYDGKKNLAELLDEAYKWT